MRMKFEDDSAVQVGELVDRSQGAARAISVRIHISPETTINLNRTFS